MTDETIVFHKLNGEFSLGSGTVILQQNFLHKNIWEKSMKFSHKLGLKANFRELFLKDSCFSGDLAKC